MKNVHITLLNTVQYIYIPFEESVPANKINDMQAHTKFLQLQQTFRAFFS